MKKKIDQLIAFVMIIVVMTVCNVSFTDANAASVENHQSGAIISAETSGAASLPNGWVSCYTLSDGKTNTFTSKGSYSGYIAGTDLCQVNFSSKSANGNVMVKYNTSKGIKTAYAPASAFIQNTSYNRYTGKLSANTKVYTKQNMKKQLGTAYKTDTIIVVSTNGNKAQIIYPTGTNNTYKMGWLNFNTASSYNPQGCFDSAVGKEGKITITGWCFDKDKLSEALWIHIYVNNTYAGALQANTYRPDVNKAYPGSGNYHGFSGTISTTKTGTVSVTAYAINIYGGTNTCLGSKTVTINVNNNSSGSFQWPVSNYYVCGNNWSEYYSARNGDHLGVDIKSSTGDTNIYAAASGIVRQSGWNDANGNCVVIEHNVNGRKFYTFYGHLSSRSVSVGESVSKGVKIGVIGNTGSSSKGAHLHFAVTTQNSTGTWGYSRNSTFATNANSTTWGGYTYYNPYYVMQYGKLP